MVVACTQAIIKVSLFGPFSPIPASLEEYHAPWRMRTFGGAMRRTTHCRILELHHSAGWKRGLFTGTGDEAHLNLTSNRVEATSLASRLSNARQAATEKVTSHLREVAQSLSRCKVLTKMRDGLSSDIFSLTFDRTFLVLWYSLQPHPWS